MVADKEKELINELEQSLRSISGNSNWLYLEFEDKVLKEDLTPIFSPTPTPSNRSTTIKDALHIHVDSGNVPNQLPLRNQNSADTRQTDQDDSNQQNHIDLDPTTATSIDSLHLRLRDCDRCRLWETRKSIVFGQGNIQADLVFIGEGPGEEEDKTGIAFIGKAGKLLSQIIQSIGISRESVFICNIVKCRPPGNRNPKPDEIESCSPFLFRQLELLQPKLIVTLGNVATKALLPEAEGIMRMRGKMTFFNGIPLIPTYHPSFLLRNASALSSVWDDMRLVRQVLFNAPQKGPTDQD